MAYRKLFKVVVDSPLGLQTINQLADNATDLREQLLVQHGGLETTSPLNLLRLGQHNLVEIPRTVGQTYLYDIQPSSRGIAMSWTGPGVEGVWRYSTGIYSVNVIGLSNWWLDATALCDDYAATYLKPLVVPVYPTAANPNFNAAFIATYALGDAVTTPVGTTRDFVLTDMAFSFTLYGEPS